MTAFLRRTFLIIFVAVTGLVAAPTPVSAGEPGDLTDATLAVTPATDLVDRQSVTVTATDFDPVGSTLYFAQCAATVTGTVSIDDCDRSNLGIRGVPEGGDVELSFTVRREINTSEGLIDCAVAPGCVIGAATLQSDLVTVVEAAVAVTSFDPNVAASPRLSIDVEAVSASASGFTVRVTCNREANVYLEGNLTQTQGSLVASSSGGAEGLVTCGTAPQDVVVALGLPSIRYRDGAASLNVYASAYDGFESADTSDVFDVRLRGTTDKVEPIERPGEVISVSILGISRSGEATFIDVQVVCSTQMLSVSLYVGVSQYAGRFLVSAEGGEEFFFCDGSRIVSVPIRPGASGTLVPGPARVTVQASGYRFDPAPGGFFTDNASAVDEVRLGGRISAVDGPIDSVEGMFISVAAGSTNAISGTVTCDEPLTVYLQASTYQIKGRVSLRASGSIGIPCDGETAFSIPISGPTQVGVATTFVYGTAYRVVGDSEELNEFVWYDSVIAETRLRR